MSAAIQGFLLNLELENRAPATLEYNRKILKNFLWFCEQQEDWPAAFDQITKGHLERFFYYLKNTKERWGQPGHSRSTMQVKASTIMRYRAVLHALWNWAVRDEIVASDPVSRIRAPKQESVLIEPLNEAEIRKLVDACRSGISENKRRDLAIVLLMLDTGLRASELCGLKLTNWDSRRVKVYGKGRKERYLPLSAPTAKAIWEYVTRDRGTSFYDELFLLKGGEPMRVDSLEALLDRRSKEAGIRHVNPHLLRHSLACQWARSGGPLHGLQALLGHETPTMSMRYGRFASDMVAELHKLHSPVERLNLRFREKK